MREARELAQESTYEYDAHPLEVKYVSFFHTRSSFYANFLYSQDNLFEWHFTVRGPKDTDFEEGR